MADAYHLGIDVGVTNVKYVRVTGGGQVIDRGIFDTGGASPTWPETVKQFVAECESSHGPAHSIGLAGPGIAAPDGSCIAWMQGRLGEIEGLIWTRFLGRTRSVPVLNDAQAALAGEAWIGAAAGAANAVLLTLGTGVGGAMMVDGRLLRGHLGRAGHFGHICLDPDGPPDVTGMPGSLEYAMGNCTLHERSNGRFSSTHALIDAHRAGDAEASTLWLRSVHQLAAGIASIINVADPEVVIVGGGIARAGRALFDPLARALDGCEWRPHGRRARIVPAALGEHAGAIGAARHAMEELT